MNSGTHTNRCPFPQYLDEILGRKAPGETPGQLGVPPTP